MSKISLQHLKSVGLEVSKWDLEPFIEHKRLNLPRYALKKGKMDLFPPLNSTFW
ncbi:hypothetical protein ACS0TY_027503 [Phlomoides rotata]